MLALLAPAIASAAQQPAVEPRFNIDAYDVDGNTLLDQETVETAVYPFMGPDRKRQDVADARDALQKAYRDKGYASVVVDVPQQDARTGIVKLHVIEVPLGRLRVVGSQYNLPSRIKEQVPSLAEGKVPNFTQVQAELADANRLPERQITPVEKKGREPGTIDVDLKVKDTLPLHASTAINNDHAQNTAELRSITNVSYGNLWQLGHSISATAILAPENLDNAEVFVGSYGIPIWSTPWTLNVSGTYSNSNVQAVAGTGVFGKGFTFGASGLLQLPPWGDLAQSVSAGLTFKHNVNDVGFFVAPGEGCNLVDGHGNAGPRSCAEYIPLTFDYQVTKQTKSASLTGTATLTLGMRGLGSGIRAIQTNRAFARGNFTKFNLDATYTRSLPWDMSLVSYLSGQVTDQPLLANEQFSAGGLTTLRGYLQSEALGDDGILASFTLNGPSLAPTMSELFGQGVVDDWRLFLFSDNAVAWMLDRLPEQRSVFPLASIGVGSKIELFSHISGNVVMGMPMRNGVATKAWHPTVQFSASTEF
ncbi:MAG: ShlB/FhaC/HecB family hemolysin secretion/activation protein [Alphaproteobacteria bacterium]|nr:ShlB/FhaC/HecB family hemolysin secretion/activation protein [Alphaproteobacteria bacterium]